MFKCPCCRYDTLDDPRLNSFEICYLCWWEDDGQNDHNAHIVVGGPNSDYSLLEARNNFKKHLLMFRPSDSRFREFNNDRIDEIKRNIILLLNNKKGLQTKMN
ncbi:MAG: CPCC family cysteine-rich protein [Promethearchaeota archaeon]